MTKNTFLFLLLNMFLSTFSYAGSPAEINEVVQNDTVSQQVSLDELVVVSTIKENSRMREQPSAVSLVSRQQMDATQVTSLKGVSALVPNFYMPDYGSRLTSAIYIRGIGSRINTPAVGMYVDNVPYTDKSAFDFNFYDIDRVDVLRGPQGTLYGRNAMGGIVRVYTRNPFNYQGADIRATYGTDSLRRSFSVAHYQRINDRFAFSASAYYEGYAGSFRNSYTGKLVDDLLSGGARFRGIFRANNRLNLDFSVSYDHNNEGAYPYYYAGPQSSVVPGQPDPYADYQGKITNNRESRYRRDMLNTGLNVEYQSDAFVMNAITSYQYLNDRMFMDQDFLASDIYTLEQRQRINTLTEELTFKNRERGGRWHWVSGANLMYQWLHTTGPVNFYTDGLRWLEGNINAFMPDVTQIPSLSRMGFSSMSVNFRDESLLMGGTFDTPTLNAALYHQSTVDLSSRLSLTLGLRLDYDRNEMRYDAPATVNYGFTLANPRSPMMHVDLQDLTAQLLYQGKLKRDYLRVLPKAALKYDLPSLGNLYLSVAKGQRSGGYNVQMFSDLLQASMRNAMMKGIQIGVSDYLQKFTAMGMPPMVIQSVTQTMADNMPIGEDPTVSQVVFRPEFSWNYELGTHLNFLDRCLQLDAATFLIRTRNQQIARFAPSGLGRMMVNAGKSLSYGAELTLLYRPDVHWRFTANYGYTHAQFTDYDAGDGNDYTHNFVPFAPQHTLNLDASYTWQISKDKFLRDLTLGADYRGTGKLYWTEDNQHHQPYYSLLDMRILFATRLADIQVWARNITATHYNTFYFISAGRGFEQHGKPSQLGLDIKFSF